MTADAEGGVWQEGGDTQAGRRGRAGIAAASWKRLSMSVSPFRPCWWLCRGTFGGASTPRGRKLPDVGQTLRAHGHPRLGWAPGELGRGSGAGSLGNRALSRGGGIRARPQGGPQRSAPVWARPSGREPPPLPASPSPAAVGGPTFLLCPSLRVHAPEGGAKREPGAPPAARDPRYFRVCVFLPGKPPPSKAPAGGVLLTMTFPLPETLPRPPPRPPAGGRSPHGTRPRASLVPRGLQCPWMSRAPPARRVSNPTWRGQRPARSGHSAKWGSPG